MKISVMSWGERMELTLEWKPWKMEKESETEGFHYQ